MASQDQALPAIAPSKALDEASAWFWQFLKTELAPYPGRAWVVGRITIAATHHHDPGDDVPYPVRIPGRHLHTLSSAARIPR
jgi:hypothetical protein